MGVRWEETSEAREIEKSVLVAMKIRVDLMSMVLEGRVVVVTVDVFHY